MTARYLLCGLEMLPSLINTMYAIVVGLIALVVGGFTTLGFCRYGWRVRPPRPVPSPEVCEP